MVVFNQLGFARDTVVRVACGASGITDGGHPLPCHAENGVLTFVAKDLPAKGWRFYPFADAEPETPCAEVTENDGGSLTRRSITSYSTAAARSPPCWTKRPAAS